jgi:DNA mismatch repair protein PMS2
MLQKTTEIHVQQLIQPLAIELTASEAQTVRDHLEAFAANGFRFDVSRPERLLLTHLPHTKQTVFGVEDVRELASLLLHDAAGPAPKLPKMRDMFASRACRSAVMIGTALPPAQMARIVANLAHLEQPWNCPHGRPTMRHLLYLADLYQNRGRGPPPAFVDAEGGDPGEAL